MKLIPFLLPSYASTCLVLQKLVSITVVMLLTLESAWAYLDPGTGSLILQGLIAGIAGALITVRLYWYKMKIFFDTTIRGMPRPDDEKLNSDSSESDDKSRLD